jgi:hypothetical protein
MLARLRLPARSLALSATGSLSTSRRTPLANGAYPEVGLRARRIGWKGKADLLVLTDDTCEITDFKTGTPDEAHKFQVHVYALLWFLDDELNPAGRAVERLVLAYQSQDVEVRPPSRQQLDALTQDLIARRRMAEEALTARPPAARPSAETCQYCSVRHMCEEYWARATQFGADGGRFGDVELEIVGQHGPTSWDAVVLRSRSVSPKTPALLRLQQPLVLKPSTRVRVLDGALALDVDAADAHVIVTLGSFSEAYCVE